MKHTDTTPRGQTLRQKGIEQAKRLEPIFKKVGITTVSLLIVLGCSKDPRVKEATDNYLDAQKDRIELQEDIKEVQDKLQKLRGQEPAAITKEQQAAEELRKAAEEVAGQQVSTIEKD